MNAFDPRQPQNRSNQGVRPMQPMIQGGADMFVPDRILELRSAADQVRHLHISIPLRPRWVRRPATPVHGHHAVAARLGGHHA
jgi:hypothetical protein